MTRCPGSGSIQSFGNCAKAALRNPSRTTIRRRIWFLLLSNGFGRLGIEPMDACGADSEPGQAIDFGARAGGGAQSDEAAVEREPDQGFVAEVLGDPDAGGSPAGLFGHGEADVFGADAR